MICGLDLGSRNVKIALMEGNELKGTYIYDTMQFYRAYARKQEGKLVVDFKRLGLPPAEKVVSTGYGRLTVEVAGAAVIPEIKAHVLGAVYQTGRKDFTLIDLGGQDSKVIQVKNGKVADFMTNDKCAASSGRYLENMAAVLGIDLEELSKHYERPVELNSTCAVFGETELIGKIVEGYSIPSLAAGVNYTIFKRILPMVKKMGNKVIVFTGGVAYNEALKNIMEKELNVEVLVPALPQFNGALGCCIYGGES
ncbi:acyl-CoA dehydratase activase [Calderihabitans maritimus]|uniref:CoA-substrate-specific enzyme activase n=1 Tax=Calderihabitans maritimus TaxID=1246530 RepID=A0A1Z5HP34_9FIRM|nr:acyl-CoA dehydratase activase [Calderihabitans maritimus]GAW91274.1 CoA-substrate-specific enzyme activase [Calderihabitans maritimus]